MPRGGSGPNEGLLWDQADSIRLTGSQSPTAMLRPPGSQNRSSCCSGENAKKFGQCPLLFLVIWGFGGFLIMVSENYTGESCQFRNPSPVDKCVNTLDAQNTATIEPYRACHHVLEMSQQYTCDSDFCPDHEWTLGGPGGKKMPACTTAPGACNLECRSRAHDWGVAACYDRNSSTEWPVDKKTHMCNCLLEPRWIEKVVVMIFATFTLPSLLLPGLIPLARPTTAMVGAMVTVGVRHVGRNQDDNTGPDYEYISWTSAIEMPTIMLLFSLMLISGFMDEIGTFQALAKFIRSKTPVRTMVNLSMVSCLLSAVLMNDTICLMLAPTVVKLIAAPGSSAKAKFPYLFALCATANIGGALTIVGNPQNNIISNSVRALALCLHCDDVD
jgi:hypothetical protein